MDCGNKVGISSALYGLGRCKTCANSGIHHPNYGKIRPVEVGRKISNTNKGKFNGINNPFYGRKHKTESLIKIGLKSKERWKDKHFIKKIKNSYPDRSGRKNSMFGKQTHGKRDKYNDIYFRSSWEINFAKFLDLSNVKWKYESKTFDLGNTTYTPDFYLPEFDCYIEIKGYWRTDALNKYKRFKRKYSNTNIKILHKKKMQEMSLI